MSKLLLRLWRHLSIKRRRQYSLLLFLVITASVTEILSIGTLFPFLAALSAPESLLALPIAQPFLRILGITRADQLFLPLTLMVCSAALIAGLTRLQLLWLSTKLSFAAGADLSIDIYRRALYQPYRVHIARNSSEVLSAITSKANSLSGKVILPVITIVSAILMIISILSALISIDPVVAISSFAGFGLVYGSISYFAKKKIIENGRIATEESTRIYKSLQEGLGGIRDVLLDGTQDAYCNIYIAADGKLRKAFIESGFIAGSPRFIMETFGIIMIAALAFFLIRGSGGAKSVLPLLGSFALGAQRLLPMLQQSYQGWINLRGAQTSLSDVLDLLDQPMPSYAGNVNPNPLPFKEKIAIEKLSFQYTPDGPWVLENINLEITKGERIGLIGSTGSGKSTLLDIILALLSPSKGTLSVDGTIINSETMRAWQVNIAHVPQSIYLADCSIAENIAFGVNFQDIDLEKVRAAAKQAQIDSHIIGLKEGYNTLVGERGIRLSGGQRQRIGIARALYKNASVIVFDEATSALDNETEEAVMQAIDGLGRNLTILMIAHRLTTVQNCDKIIELNSGKLVRTGTYKELFRESETKESLVS